MWKPIYRFAVAAGTFVFAVLNAAWAIAKLVLDNYGRASAVTGANSPADLGTRALDWLFKTPWEAPALIAAALVVGWLILSYRLIAGAGLHASDNGDTPPTEFVFGREYKQILKGVSFDGSRLPHERSEGDPSAPLQGRRFATATPSQIIELCGRVPPLLAKQVLAHLIHRIAAIRWRVSCKALIAFTELGVKAIQFT